MTALTFILGVFPMIVAKGAGAASQIAIGSSVFFGMIAATFIGIIFIPALFALFESSFLFEYSLIFSITIKTSLLYNFY